MDFKNAVIEHLASILNLDKSTLTDIVEIPPQRDMGDFAFPCFRFAKEYKKAPNLIAIDFAETLEASEEVADFIDRIEAAGPYLNIYLNRAFYTASVARSVLDAGEDFLKSDRGAGETVLVEFSSPNIAKPFHVGHGFSTILGDVMANLYEHVGHDVLRLNHLGDYGTQFGKLMVAYEKWGDEDKLNENAIAELVRIYIKFHEVAENEPELEDEARVRFRNLENGEEYEYNLWKKFREYSLVEFKDTYDRMGIRFDSYKGEADYVDVLSDVVDILDEKGLLTESEGALVVDLEDEGMPPCIIRKSDGSSIYATRDIAAALYRKEEYDFSKLVYVVGLPQSLHFKQFFTVLKKAGFEWANDMYFVGFGLVKFPGDVKFSTRSGEVIYLEELLDETVNKTKEIIVENNKNREEQMSPEEISESAEIIGLAAVRYTYIRNGRERDIIFDWDEVLDFEGDSAPYMLYSYARARSILRKSGLSRSDLIEADLSLLDSAEEFELADEINKLHNSLDKAIENNEPSTLARQVMATARSFSKFYNQVSILQAYSEELKLARLALAEAFSTAMIVALRLLGMDTVERM